MWSDSESRNLSSKHTGPRNSLPQLDCYQKVYTIWDLTESSSCRLPVFESLIVLGSSSSSSSYLRYPAWWPCSISFKFVVFKKWYNYQCGWLIILTPFKFLYHSSYFWSHGPFFGGALQVLLNSQTHDQPDKTQRVSTNKNGRRRLVHAENQKSSVIL